MGYIQEEHIVQKRLVLTSSDVAKHNMRMKRRHEDYVSTPGMTAFCRHLVPCPICGKTPYPSVIEGYNSDWSVKYHSVKMNCEGSHIGCGNWYKTLAKAGKDWNKRTKEQWQIDLDRDIEIRYAREHGTKVPWDREATP